MTWFVTKDDINDALESNTRFIDISSLDFIVKWKCKSAGSDGTVCAQNISALTPSREFQIFYQFGVLSIVFGGETKLTGYTPPDRSGDFSIKFEGSTYTIYRNNLQVNSDTFIRGANDEPLATWTWGARHAGIGAYGFFWDVDLSKCSVEGLDGTLIANWDFDNSSHAPGIVTVSETVSGADLVGINMETDGSAWITDSITSIATGTATPSQTKSNVVTGGKTIILTLTGDTYVAAGATFDAQRQFFLDGLNSAQSETTGWNAEVRDKEVVGAVVRTSSTVVTITLSASASYDISAPEVITATIPPDALVLSDVSNISTPTFSVVPDAVDGTGALQAGSSIISGVAKRVVTSAGSLVSSSPTISSLSKIIKTSNGNIVSSSAIVAGLSVRKITSSGSIVSTSAVINGQADGVELKGFLQGTILVKSALTGGLEINVSDN